MTATTDSSSATAIPAPLRIEDVQAEDWSEEVDVIVVGFGGAGACAAVEAAERGAQVLAVDRFGGGGATAMSGGIVYAGGGTEHQRAAGFEDSPSEMFAYLSLETRGVVSDATLRDFCETSVAQQQWLQEHGVKFDSTYCPIKTSYPNQRYFLYHSGNEQIAEYARQAKPAPRGHRVVGKGLSGPALFEPLAAAAKAAGVRVLPRCEVTRLVVDGAGAVVGVEVARLATGSKRERAHMARERSYKRFHARIPPLADRALERMRKLEVGEREMLLLRARKGVILAAGGFALNPAMMAEQAPKYTGALPIGGPGDSGAGIRLGESVGGATALMSRVSAWRFINPPQAWMKAIIVNQAGERYVDEGVYGAKIGHHMVQEQGGRSHLIMNRRIFRAALRQVLPWKVWFFQFLGTLACVLKNTKRARTLGALAEKIGVSAAALEQTVADYNQGCESGQDALAKSASLLEAMTQGPYYAMDISIDNKIFPCPIITLGGLVVDERSSAVERKDGSLVPGLYAVGRNAVGIPSHAYVSGLSLADCVYSGRRAARHAVSGIETGSR